MSPHTTWIITPYTQQVTFCAFSAWSALKVEKGFTVPLSMLMRSSAAPYCFLRCFHSENVTPFHTALSDTKAPFGFLRRVISCTDFLTAAKWNTRCFVLSLVKLSHKNWEPGGGFIFIFHVHLNRCWVYVRHKLSAKYLGVILRCLINTISSILTNLRPCTDISEDHNNWIIL